MHAVPFGQTPSAVQSRLHVPLLQYPNKHWILFEHRLPTSPAPVGKQSPSRALPTLPSATQAFPYGQPP